MASILQLLSELGRRTISALLLTAIIWPLFYFNAIAPFLADLSHEYTSFTVAAAGHGDNIGSAILHAHHESRQLEEHEDHEHIDAEVELGLGGKTTEYLEQSQSVAYSGGTQQLMLSGGVQIV